MERKELTRKDLEAIAAGSSLVVPGLIGQMVFLVYAADLEAAGLTVTDLAGRLGVTVDEINIR